MDPLLEQFLNEARENLAFIDQNIEEIGGDDPELLNSVFRAAHTLKGGSGIVGFESVKEITHHAEDLLDMLRAEKIEFASGMTDALYNAFDEVMNLVEAAEESGEIVDSDEETVANIVAELSAQMGKDKVEEDNWKVPFLLATNISEMVNYPLKTLRGIDSFKLPFVNKELDEDFCNNSNFYAVLFDVDDSCMVYGNDPIYTLSLLADKVLGVFSCVSDENAKSILSGIDDEDGLILKTHIVAYIHATYEEIEDALFNFIDEIHLLPLDISTMLTVSNGDSGHQIDSLKELFDIAEDLDLTGIKDEVERSLSLIGKESLQYAQLERFLDIVGLIDSSDTTKLATFFDNIYKGEIYTPLVLTQEKSTEIVEAEPEKIEVTESVATEEPTIELNEVTQAVLTGMLEQQKKAIKYIETGDDFLRVLSIMDKMRKFIPSMPSSFSSKDEVESFINKELGLSV
ncbi:MAG: Hpt domain-containing protein, partial [Campylobacterota bacterium]|nr:Hpt domain-containing protein [Campylobacterota bacterium]